MGEKGKKFFSLSSLQLKHDQGGVCCIRMRITQILGALVYPESHILNGLYINTLKHIIGFELPQPYINH